jgi:hypothetical protein
VESWSEDGIAMQAEIWEDLILPGLTLLAVSIPSYLAATARLAPTGFWGRQPGRTRTLPLHAGGLTISGAPYPQGSLLPRQLLKKASATERLPKGFLAQRQKTTDTAPISLS